MKKYKKPVEQLALRNVIVNLEKTFNKKVVLIGSNNMKDRTGGLIKTIFYGFYVPNFLELGSKVSNSKVLKFKYGNLVISDIRLLLPMLLDVENITTFFLLDDDEKINLASSYLSKELFDIIKNHSNVILYSMQKKMDNISKFNYAEMATVELYHKIIVKVYRDKVTLQQAVRETTLNKREIKEIEMATKEEFKDRVSKYKKYNIIETSDSFDSFKEQVSKVIVSTLSGKRVL